MDPGQNFNFHCDIFIHILFATLGGEKEGRSDTAIKTQYKTPKSKQEIIYKCKGYFNTKYNY